MPLPHLGDWMQDGQPWSQSQEEMARKRAAYWTCGFGILLFWPLGAALGGVVGSVVPDTDALGLDAMFPAVLLALILPALRDRATLSSAVVGAALALATTPFLPAGLPLPMPEAHSRPVFNVVLSIQYRSRQCKVFATFNFQLWQLNVALLALSSGNFSLSLQNTGLPATIFRAKTQHAPRRGGNSN